MTSTAAAIISAYIVAAGLICWASDARNGPAWAGLFIIGGLLATAAARAVFVPEVVFIAVALVWVPIGSAIAVRGEGAVAALLILSGLCYGGAQVAGASVPGWSLWFTIADALGIAALLVVLAGGDDGILGMVRRARAGMVFGSGRGNSGRGACHPALEKEKQA